MFGLLKKTLKDGIKKLTGKEEAKPEKKAKPTKPQETLREKKPAASKKEKPVKEKVEKREERHEKVSKRLDERVDRIEEKYERVEQKVELERPEEKAKPKLGFFERIGKRAITESDINDFFKESEMDMLQSDVAVEVIDSLKAGLKKRLVDTTAGRGSVGEMVEKAFKESLMDVISQGDVDLERVIKDAKKEGRPACLVFLGFNGSGKTTTIARVANYLKKKGHLPVLAAGDTFRAASIEQLEIHGERLGVKVIKHQYNADSAAVIFDAVKYAQGKGNDVVVAHTAGRTHTDKNLMDELRKIVRVNKPDLKILVVDSLTGNDAVEQARVFNEAAGVDAVVMTKTDVNPKGGSILSVCYAIKKPILFLGTGQEYGDIEFFDPEKFVDQLME